MINDQISSTIASMKDIMVNTADDDDNDDDVNNYVFYSKPFSSQ
jgi:hypothetical protein